MGAGRCGCRVATAGVRGFLIAALSDLAGENPTAWERFLGLAAALVSGLALGIGASLHRQRRMVSRHMASQHPGVPVPAKPRG